MIDAHRMESFWSSHAEYRPHTHGHEEGEVQVSSRWTPKCVGEPIEGSGTLPETCHSLTLFVPIIERAVKDRLWPIPGTSALRQ